LALSASLLPVSSSSTVESISASSKTKRRPSAHSSIGKGKWWSEWRRASGPSPLAQACLNAIQIAKTEKAERGGATADERLAAAEERLAAAEERLATNPPPWPGWGVAPLPSTLAGRVAAVLRQFYAADLPRKEIERQLRFGEDQFRFPERRDLGTFALGTLKKALVLARAQSARRDQR
jgi:hypothetical protein